MKKIKNVLIISTIIVLIDQLIKILISNNIPYLKSIKIIPNFFYLSNVHNEGGAWSILSGNIFLLIFVAVLALILILSYLYNQKNLSKWDIIIYSILIGGIAGNLLDRIIYNYVIDYLEFIIINYHYPVFNFADICIVVSVFALIFISIKEDVCKKKSLK